MRNELLNMFVSKNNKSNFFEALTTDKMNKEEQQPTYALPQC